ncbi:hypothetical protein M514_06645 [Trichuris suis]|uniref:Uncharacterized protein n=1 Tax=Trichuris suis TaxID=68888 RepID=A0A085NHS1_9BILA|nr:hypothetical protein M514_06645 [Trichuris suis]
MTKSNGAENMSSNFLCTFFVIPGNISWGYWLSLDEYKLARPPTTTNSIFYVYIESFSLDGIFCRFHKAEEALNVSHCLSFNDISFE